MDTMRKIGVVGLLLVAAMAVGCSRTFEFTVRNVAPRAFDVSMNGPEGIDHLGVMNPTVMVKHRIKVEDDEFPAACWIQAGKTLKKFTLQKTDKDQQFIYIEENEIVGPIDSDTQVKKGSSSKVQTVEPNKPVLKGDNPPGPGDTKPPGTGGGSGVIIEQRPVIE